MATKRSARASRTKSSPKRRSGRRSGGSGATRTRPRRFRLSPEVLPLAMEIDLEVDPEKSDVYSGVVRLSLHLARPRTAIELHAHGLRVKAPEIRAQGATQRGKVVLHPEREIAEIAFPDKLPAGGATLTLRFTGKLREDLSGFYRVFAEGRPYAITQLAAAYARRFVPCFDEPGMKVRMTLRVTTGAQHQVIANMPVAREVPQPDGRKTVHFEPTPPLSTYLFALAIGGFYPSRTEYVGPTPITVWQVGEREALGDFALEVAQASLERLEEWFGIPHPYAKLDLVAVPGLQFGAMENAGAVFFREALLLVDRTTASLDEQKRAAEVIAHELAHMWYGNLVTMAWWDDLWLNEAFATWMAFVVLDRWRPEWCIWQTFLARRAAALDADALAHTHPIKLPVRSADEAAENFDLITYEKGASVVRMLAEFLGQETFREGVGLYLTRHRERNTVANDLWDALAEVSGENVQAIVDPWLLEPGFPVVSIAHRERAGEPVVALRQDRMRSPKKETRKPNAPWPVPMIGRVATREDDATREVTHLLRRRSQSVATQGASLSLLYGNANESGFYRPLHEASLLEDLAENLDRLRPIERQGLVQHQWALVRSGYGELEGLLALLARVGAEHDPDVLAAASTPLRSLCGTLAPDFAPDLEAKLRGWVEVYYGGQVDELGWVPAPAEDARTRARRAQVLSIAGEIGEATAVLEEAALRCLAYLDDPASLPAEQSDAVVTMAARSGGSALYERFRRAMHEAKTPQEQRRFLMALADFRPAELTDRTLALCLSEEVASQDLGFLLARLLGNHEARFATWDFIKRRWRHLRTRIPAQLSAHLLGATPALLTPTHRDEVARFFATHPLPAGDRALRQALERFAEYAAFRGRIGPQLVAAMGAPEVSQRP